MIGTLAAVFGCANVALRKELCGFGEVAEWFKAAVLKTAIREHRHPAEMRKTRTTPDRNNRVLDLFAKNIQTQESAQ